MTDTRRLDLTLPDGTAVAAIATEPRLSEAPLAAYVFAHGAGAGIEHAFMEDVDQSLGRRRIACLRYQFPYMQAGKRRVDSPATAHAPVRAAVALARQLWPATPLFAGGKSFGGRMSSQAQAQSPLPGVRGLVFLGFPLHPAGKPSVARAEHLAAVQIPMLFIRGSRDALAEAGPYASMQADLAGMASMRGHRGRRPWLRGAAAQRQDGCRSARRGRGRHAGLGAAPALTAFGRRGLSPRTPIARRSERWPRAACDTGPDIPHLAPAGPAGCAART